MSKPMTPFIKTHLPCPNCSSSDAYSIREDGSGFCFSCKAGTKSGTQPEQGDSMTTQTMPSHRGIKEGTFKKFNVTAEVRSDGTLNAIVFPRPNKTTLFKSLKEKRFWSRGVASEGLSLFGSDVFPAGSGKAVTITEGYLDTLSHYDMMGPYPVVGVQSASSAKKECAQAYEYLNSFDKIYVAFDSDLPGETATKEVARLFDFNKVYVTKLNKTLKDANGYLQAKKAREYTRTWWGSQRFLLEGIVSSFSGFDRVFDDDKIKPSVSYPWETLQSLTYGIRTGELVLVTAMEGLGKTEVFRALEYHILKQTTDNIGIIHLEESKARTLKGLVGYELKTPVHLPDHSVSKEALKEAIRTVSTRDDRIHIYSHFGSDDPDVLLSMVRFMAGACECKYVFLDHITMAVTGLQGEGERKALDYLSTRLAMMVEELDFSLFLISHVNDEGKTRGSRNISKVADIRVDLYRDITAVSEEVRNLTKLTVTKNRFSGKTGPAGVLEFNTETFTLAEREPTDETMPF